MIWLAWAYVVALGALGVHAALDDLHDGDPFLIVVADILGVAVFAVFTIAAWCNGQFSLLEPAYPLLYPAAILWTVGRSIQESRKLPRDPDFNDQGMRWLRVAASLLLVVILLPAIVGGAIVLMR